MRGRQMRGEFFGTGAPKICVPVMGRKPTELRQSIMQAAAKEPGLIEWRADRLEEPSFIGGCSAFFPELAPDIFTIFTFRTVEEGGCGRTAYYGSACSAAIESGMFDAIDLEMHRDRSMILERAEHAHEKGMGVIASWHDFSCTPENDELLENVRLGTELGGDVIKIAVMPEDERDVERLREFALAAFKEAGRPLIIIGMGDAGRITRTDPAAFKSCVTFASAGASSAPGQIDIDELRRYL
ncbi:MAG: type I 3-dehydroquinate dehydratase [Lachnospiraceae bacterium]|nr:type I 3-dehydroquinate dehydratase [Lachnospiraceae bacterium]